MSNPYLRPCPFCGYSKPFVTSIHPEESIKFYWVFCDNCEAQGPQREFEEAAVTMWNSRDMNIQTLRLWDKHRERFRHIDKILFDEWGAIWKVFVKDTPQSIGCWLFPYEFEITVHTPDLVTECVPNEINELQKCEK